MIRRTLGLCALLLVSVTACYLYSTPPAASAGEPAPVHGAIPADVRARALQADFAAGCFWGSESVFRATPGVLATEVGYEGGTTTNPTYNDVCTDKTGHAETVRVLYDPQKISYQQLLEVFFEHHDPTTTDRQGPDTGTQYRSVIFYHSDDQKKLAEAEKQKRDRSGDYVGPIVTEILPAATFTRAEDYHQQYFEKQGMNDVCHLGNGKKTK